MWKGWIIEESLEDTAILSRLKIAGSGVEDNEEGDRVETWRIDTVEIDDKDIDKIAKQMERLMKPGFYVHFTDYKNLVIVFRGKSFKIRLEKVLKEKEFGAVEFKAEPRDMKIWRDALEYGIKKGKVDPRYIVRVE